MKLILELAGHSEAEDDEPAGEHDNLGGSHDIAEPAATEHDGWCFGFSAAKER